MTGLQRAAWMEWPHNLRFRKAGRKPVAGGRWSIRRDPRRGCPPNRRWKAWTDGKGRAFSRRFATHAEAVDWAQFCARVFAQCKGTDTDPAVIIRARMAAERAMQRANLSIVE